MKYSFTFPSGFVAGTERLPTRFSIKPIFNNFARRIKKLPNGYINYSSTISM